MASVGFVWLAAIVGVVLVATLAPVDRRIEWVVMTFAATIVLSFVVQLAIQRTQGFLVRVMASVAGALVVLATATGIFVLVSGAG